MPDQDLTIYTRRPQAEATCPACQFRSRSRWPDDDVPETFPEHTCRGKPATPQSTLDARVRAAAQVHLQRELRIRAERLADITAGRG
jgi:hypothetical protein